MRTRYTFRNGETLEIRADDDGFWITVHPNGEEHDGRPVHVNEEGYIDKGAGGTLNGQKYAGQNGGTVYNIEHSTSLKQVIQHIAKLPLFSTVNRSGVIYKNIGKNSWLVNGKRPTVEDDFIGRIVYNEKAKVTEDKREYVEKINELLEQSNPITISQDELNLGNALTKLPIGQTLKADNHYYTMQENGKLLHSTFTPLGYKSKEQDTDICAENLLSNFAGNIEIIKEPLDFKVIEEDDKLKSSEKYYKDAGKKALVEFEKQYQKAVQGNDASKIDELKDELEKSDKKYMGLYDEYKKIKKYRNTLLSSSEEFKKVDKEYSAIINELNKEYAHYSDILKDIDKLKAKSKGWVSKLMVDFLESQRGEKCGADEKDIREHLHNGKSKVINNLVEAYQMYPRSWVEKSMKAGKMTVGKTQRGYYSYGGDAIKLSGNSDFSITTTAVHELGHRFEHINPTLYKAAREFLERRTKGEQAEWLGQGYKRSEKAKKDNFVTPYIGKQYSSCTEVLSMGFQYAFREPEMLLKDRDYAEFILGVLVKG